MNRIVSEELEKLKQMEPGEVARAYQALADRVSQAENERVRRKRLFLTDAELNDKMVLIYAGQIIADYFVGVALGIH